jgi:ornithine carbamoyltransferase
MLSDFAHPLQAVADVLTMQQSLGDLAGKTVTYVGDFNNVARSLCEASAMLGMHIRLGCPEGYDAKDNELLGFTELGAASVEQYRDVSIAVNGAHAVHTDTWTSMGQESEIMSLADAKAIFMHCLPAHRGQEVSPSVIDGPQSKIYQQAHNRMHAARGVLAFLMGAQK